MKQLSEILAKINQSSPRKVQDLVLAVYALQEGDVTTENEWDSPHPLQVRWKSQIIHS